ncbi:MAG: class I SAM-dependent RNA methyltransferase [Ruminococcaceae bacterium]|nr:class I SAM-dependent RNA methyltransferase [Oscillospiraceae bacterium]
MKFVATCLFGLERFVGEQIDALGYKRLETIDGRVIFEGDENAIARCNINFRYAERLFILMGEFRASTFTELFDGTKALPWEDFIGERDAFPVKGHSIKSALFSIPDCQKIVKKAVVERLKTKYNVSYFVESRTKYQIEFFILNDKAYLMIDTTGEGLYKRGYRLKANEAPIRETLAASMCNVARLRNDVLLWDPMCGSGTIAIEGALMLSNTAPGIRRSFAAESFGFLPSSSWQSARGEAIDNIKQDHFEIYGSDIDTNSLEIAAENAKRAGVANRIKFFKMDFKDIDTRGRRGTIVTNPPYGERLSDIAGAEELYRQMGKAFSKLERWQIYVITSHEKFEYFYGRRADKVRKLYNGMIKCNFYQFFKNDKGFEKKKITK